MAFVSINPTTGRRIAVHREHNAAQIERAVARATVAQRRWAALRVTQRLTCFAALSRALGEDLEELALLATREMGKPIAQARTEVEKCRQLCAYLKQHAARLIADERSPGAPANARVSFEPLGVVLAIMPWNFPFWQVLRAAGPALAMGNAVLLKPAPGVAGCARVLEKIFLRAGFPPGVFQVLLTGAGPVARLIADPRVHGVTLTGSSAAGKAIAALAGAAMKPGVFELGGSDPAIIFDDADLAHAAETCAYARLINAGQSCICTKRIIVVRAVRPEFETQLVARMAARRVGDPMDAATEIGPLARADLRDKLHAQVQRSLEQGARLLLGGEPLRGPGFFYAPTVLTDVRPGMAVHDEETFGPVAAIVTVRDEAEAVLVANASDYGLGASIFTRRPARARRVARQLATGCVFVNDFVRSSPELPFGGVKQSGYGRELGAWGLRAFANVKTIVDA